MTIGAIASCALLLLAASPSPSPSYHLVRKVALGGEGGWDYLVLDAATRRLYVPRSTHVAVLDTDTDAIVGDLPDTQGVHGVALAPELGRGFTSNGRSATATVFDLKTLAVLGQVKTGDNPDAILYDPSTKRVFTFNGRSADATAIDAATGTVAGTLPLGGRPEFAVTDGKGRVYVNLEDTNELLALDPQALTVKARWPLKPCEAPTGLAIDVAHRRLFAGCGNRLMAVVDADSGRVVTTLPIGEGVDATAFDPEQRLVFASNGDGTLTVVAEDSPDAFHVVANVVTQRGARTLALDAKTRRVYLATAQLGPPQSPTPGTAHPRPAVVPGSFVILVFGE